MMAPPAVQFPGDQHAASAPGLFPVLAGPGSRIALPQVPFTSSATNAWKTRGLLVPPAHRAVAW